MSFTVSLNLESYLDFHNISDLSFTVFVRLNSFYWGITAKMVYRHMWYVLWQVLLLTTLKPLCRGVLSVSFVGSRAMSRGTVQAAPAPAVGCLHMASRCVKSPHYGTNTASVVGWQDTSLMWVCPWSCSCIKGNSEGVFFFCFYPCVDHIYEVLISANGSSSSAVLFFLYPCTKL